MKQQLGTFDEKFRTSFWKQLISLVVLLTFLTPLALFNPSWIFVGKSFFRNWDSNPVHSNADSHWRDAYDHLAIRQTQIQWVWDV